MPPLYFAAIMPLTARFDYRAARQADYARDLYDCRRMLRLVGFDRFRRAAVLSSSLMATCRPRPFQGVVL